MKTLQEFLSESKAKQGAYYVVETPSKANGMEPKLVSGPHKTVKEAEKAGGDSYYGINQDKVIAILDGGKLMHVDSNTHKATDTSLAHSIGNRSIKDLEKHLGLK